MSSVIAVLCSDLHISSRPSWRSAEPDWFAAMARSLDEMKVIAQTYNVPVVCAGDIFDRWYCSPEIINFAIEHLPQGMYSVRGNHDLPNHNHSEIMKSAYQTLVEAGTIIDLQPGEPIRHINTVLYGFPWGFDVIPLKIKKEPGDVHLAVVHQYLYLTPDTGYVGVSKDLSVVRSLSKFEGYDAAVIGDNHISWVF